MTENADNAVRQETVNQETVNRAAVNQETLSNLLRENRRFPPPQEVADHANVTAAAWMAGASGSRPATRSQV